MPPQEVDKRQAAREVIDILHEIATLLNTNLNRTQLSFCVSLIENGVNPEALANVIRDLREQYPEPLEPELGDEEGDA
ncbi:putative mitotic-spindle organizing protein 1 protein [Lasiodiplodia theobromae]|uniref:Mitotic-spindle organizing protein 1 n=2 Tax=Lasiodiplodia TaxID=66739 RepID=A0A5N5DND5_9PEZI|nr:Mitotic-spindle organizing protein [Lasiodiplodia theobromae]KAB2579435.1 Mitotic-spindle organizing protein 1 [Lasiodiplodia theobromae]KAF4542252.1 Mitotic-spindle organizing protein [Lasiodiplodia theobromae]KAF9635318.1 putative mitotic-spindle organizing protein 1 protein [Lasiodiplodia theobromae]KAK0665051.1 Mitotic-spindle organizing protein 1 [Lasiodiplodia hormozganensis]